MTEAKVARKTRGGPKPVLSADRSLRIGTMSKASDAVANGKPNLAPAGPKVKHKLVRDSFTIPKAEYEVLEGLKHRAVNLKRPAKKSELLRAGVAALHGMTDKAFLSALNGVTSLKTGRPKGSGAAKKSAGAT